MLPLKKFSAGLVLVLHLISSFCYLQGEKTVITQRRIWNSAFTYLIFFFLPSYVKVSASSLNQSCWRGVGSSDPTGRWRTERPVFPFSPEQRAAASDHISPKSIEQPLRLRDQEQSSCFPLPCRSSEVRRSPPALPGPHRLGSDRCTSHPLPGVW